MRSPLSSGEKVRGFSAAFCPYLPSRVVREPASLNRTTYVMRVTARG